MMAQFLDLVNEVLRRAGQPTLGNLKTLNTPAKQVVDFIAQVYADLLMTTYLPQVQQTLTLTLQPNESTVNVTFLGTTPDLIDITRVYRKKGVYRYQMAYYTHPDIEPLLPETGPEPFAFCFQGELLTLLPAPTEAVTLQLTFTPSPSYLPAITDNVIFPAGWERLLVLGGLAYLYQFLGEPTARVAFQQFELAKLQLKAKAIRHKGYRIRGSRPPFSF
jgi:hypothetical protein